VSGQAHIAPSPHRFTREEYHRMGATGLFADERVELLDGTIVTMSPHSTHHAAVLHRLGKSLARAVGDELDVRTQLPVVLDDWSEPEPDVVVCRADSHDYEGGHPRPGDVVLVCEVASSSLTFDRTTKAAAYAASGIPTYWIVDLEVRTIVVLDQPEPTTRRYRREKRAADGDTIEAPSGTKLAVSEILPAH
jgi:Uma2 family endonuclease